MCRLLGVVTRAPIPLADSLADLLGPFTELSHEHCDGWGLAARQADGELAVTKDVLPAHASPAFLAATTATAADAALLHIRLASEGMATDLRNTHPFTEGGFAFAHNGWFAPSDTVDDLIDPDLLATADGGTDSERYFLRVLTRMREEDLVDALALAAADIRARAAQFASLNCLLLTPDALYAYTDEDPDSEVSRRRGPDFFPLRYRAEADRVVVASSGIPQDAEGWSTLPYRQVLEIRRSDLRVSTHAVHPLHALHALR